MLYYSPGTSNVSSEQLCISSFKNQTHTESSFQQSLDDRFGTFLPFPSALGLQKNYNLRIPSHSSPIITYQSKYYKCWTDLVAIE